MTKEQLIALGISEENATKIMESLNGSFVTKARFDEVNNANKTLKDDLKSRDQQLDDLKKVDAAGLQAEITKLQAENKTAQDKHDAELKQLKMDNAVEKALATAKAKNLVAAKALLDLNNVEFDGEAIKGLDDQLKKLKEAEDTKFMFDADAQQKPNFKGIKPGEKKDGTPGNEKPASLFDAVRASLESQVGQQ